MDALSWRALREADLPALTALAGACLSADGGQPYADSPAFLSGCYLTGARTYAGFDDASLVCVSSLREPAPDSVTTGLVHPEWRRRGIGGYAFDWAAYQAGAGQAGAGGIRAQTEALSPGAHALYLSRGLSQVFAEDVMRLPASAGLPPVRPPNGLVLSRWGEADPARFHAVYEAAFRERPGFPGWPRARWIEQLSDDEDFRADWTLLATVGDTDPGFVVAATGGWIAQVGVLPAARGVGLGALLIAEAVKRMRSAGETTITLNVNVNNPHAAALYRRLGFSYAGRRAKYEVAKPG
jgi:mycothiol synthase